MADDVKNVTYQVQLTGPIHTNLPDEQSVYRVIDHYGDRVERIVRITTTVEFGDATHSLFTGAPRNHWHYACPSECCPVHGCKHDFPKCPVGTGETAPLHPENNNGCERCAEGSDG